MQTTSTPNRIAPRRMLVRAPAREGASGRSTLDATRRRILVVEDEAVVAMEIGALLEEAGYQVVGLTGSAAEAVAGSRRLSPDLVVMDITLKDGNGVAAAEQILAEKGIRSVFVSATSDAATVSRARSVGAAFIRKPYDSDALLRAVAAALGD